MRGPSRAVLIICRETEIVRSLVRDLQRRGHDVLTAADSESAIALMEQQAAGTALVEIPMGRKVIERFAGELPILAFTSGDVAGSVPGAEAGPSPLRDFVDAVSAAWDRRRLAPAAGGESMLPQDLRAISGDRPARATILLVEGEPLVRTFVRMALEHHGYAVLEARDSQEAVHLSEQHPGDIDLMLAELNLPRTTGLELAERLLRTRPTTRIAFMSGLTTNLAIQQFDLKEHTALLEKPFTVETLVRKIQEVLGS